MPGFAWSVAGLTPGRSLRYTRRSGATDGHVSNRIWHSFPQANRDAECSWGAGKRGAAGEAEPSRHVPVAISTWTAGNGVRLVDAAHATLHPRQWIDTGRSCGVDPLQMPLMRSQARDWSKVTDPLLILHIWANPLNGLRANEASRVDR